MSLEYRTLLIYGYIREIENILQSKIIPTTINALCLKYFGTKIHNFFYIWSSKSKAEHKLNIIDLETKKFQRKEIISWQPLPIRTYCTSHFIPNIQIPTSIASKCKINLKQHKQYNMLAIIGGTIDHSQTKKHAKNNLILFDAVGPYQKNNQKNVNISSIKTFFYDGNL